MRWLTVLNNPHEIELLFRLVTLRLKYVLVSVSWAHEAFDKLFEQVHVDFRIDLWK